jgi:mRNA interferase RelE/StbE
VSYRVQLTSRARKDLADLDPPIRIVVAARIDEIGTAPYLDAERVVSAPGVHRVKVRQWRILLMINDDDRLVIVQRIRHRRDAYRP